MPCHAMHPIQDLFLESFSYVLQFDMHFYMHSYVDKNFILVKSRCYKQATRAGAEVVLTSWCERKLHEKGEISGRMRDSSANKIMSRPLRTAAKTTMTKIEPAPTGGP
jgi:hypothetical protein